MGKLNGKVALITGGARGMGRATALKVAAEGADVVVCDVPAQLSDVPYKMGTDALETTRAEIEALGRRALAVKADVRSAEDMRGAVQRCVDELGGIDIVVANAGIGLPGTWDTTEDLWDLTIDVNLKGAFLTCQAAIPHLIDQGRGGSIVLTASTAGIRAYFGLLAYTASKHGVIGLTRALSADLGAHNIRVNAICPGFTATPIVVNDYFMDLLSGGEGGTEDHLAFFGRSTGLMPEPWVEADDIGNAACWLASDDARFVTGIALPVDLGTANQPPGIPPYGMELIAEARAGAGTS